MRRTNLASHHIHTGKFILKMSDIGMMTLCCRKLRWGEEMVPVFDERRPRGHFVRVQAPHLGRGAGGRLLALKYVAVIGVEIHVGPVSRWPL